MKTIKVKEFVVPGDYDGEVNENGNRAIRHFLNLIN